MNKYGIMSTLSENLSSLLSVFTLITFEFEYSSAKILLAPPVDIKIKIDLVG